MSKPVLTVKFTEVLPVIKTIAGSLHVRMMMLLAETWVCMMHAYVRSVRLLHAPPQT